MKKSTTTGSVWPFKAQCICAGMVAQAGMIGAVYTVLTLVFMPISFGPVQFRVSEALCMLPCFTPAAVPGLFVGCLLSNILGGAVAMDVVFGSLATFIGALGSRVLRRHGWCACLPPIAANTLIVPLVLRYGYGAEGLLPFMMLTVGIGEVLAIGVLGNILRILLERYEGVLFRA